jgi:hypothetical protein
LAAADARYRPGRSDRAQPKAGNRPRSTGQRRTSAQAPSAQKNRTPWSTMEPGLSAATPQQPPTRAISSAVKVSLAGPAAAREIFRGWHGHHRSAEIATDIIEIQHRCSGTAC